ncbi:MAG: stage II sporulation protein E, partial [Oscillibacter sp.]|nr:stage II sporulation protein E [Oscillibacter sp.]
MAAREDLYTKLVKWRGAAARAGQNGLSGSAVQLAAEVGIHLLLGAVLAGGVVFDGCAPFGIAMVAAAGTGLCGGGALLGAGFGYLTLLPFSDGLRYLSAAILTFAVAFAFYDVKPLRRPWAMAVVAGVMNGCTGFIYLADSPWSAADVVYFLTELGITVGASFCFRQVLLPLRQSRDDRELSDKQRISLLVMVCCVLISLSSLYFWKDISLGRSAAVLCVLAGAWKGGSAMGALLGVTIGLSMDLAGGQPPLYAMAWGLAALAAGSCRGKARHSAAIAFVLGNAAATLWTWESGMRISVLYEVFLGSITFMALPERLWKHLVPLVASQYQSAAGQVGQEYVRRRLEATAGAFRSLYESMRGAFRAPANDNDVAAVFDRAAYRVCRKCSLRMSCWEREYVN